MLCSIISRLFSPSSACRVLLPAALALAACRVDAADAPLSPAAVRLKNDVAYLADDAREGRAPGTKGIEASADYIAKQFKELGLVPAPGLDDYFQKFSLRGSSKLDGTPKLAFDLGGETIEAKSGTDFSALGLGKGASVADLPVVFVGYGITAKDDPISYDDYAGIDVKGKAVLMLRLEPQNADPKSVFDGTNTTRHADLRVKAINAFQHGAAAVILVNNGVSAKEKDVLLPFNYTGGDQATTIPFFMVSRSLADRLLAKSGRSLAEVEKQIDAALEPQSIALEGVKTTGEYVVKRDAIETKNVIGVLEGSGPHADETIIVGAHYDHLGNGGLMSGSLAFMSNAIHNGADDNASGTSLVLELARRLSKRIDPLPRRVVFMLFTAEEKGLIGSMHYVNNPLIPLDKTVMMINFDMVGRLNDKDELSVFGVGSTPGADELVDALGAGAGFKIKKIRGMSDGIGGSDHQSFYMKGIPVLFAFTGLHSDYHRPSDDTDKINFEGMSRIADFGELLLLEIARRPERPAFTKAEGRGVAAHGSPTAKPEAAKLDAKSAEKMPAGAAHAAGAGDAAPDPARVAIRAYFGSIPDYEEGDTGVKLSGVSEGGPAEKAGLETGDVIIGFGGKPVATIQDYTEAIARQKPGDKVEVRFLRDGKEMKVEVGLTVRPGGPK
ncbi:MAG: M28 family peptidase [Isosphaeraceae bacterium]|nr:M28 family peptidase [Isosphaeraceae bacterium]